MRFVALGVLGLHNFKVHKWIAKPLYNCNVCMSHVYTLICGLCWDYPLWQIAVAWLLVIGVNITLNRISYYD